MNAGAFDQEKITLQLRADAEEKLAHNPMHRNHSVLNKQLLLHELQVRGIELEMQNEQLQETMVKLAESYIQFTDLYEYAPIGYLTVDLQGVITKINLQGASLFFEDRSCLIDRRLAIFIAESDRNKWAHHFSQLVSSGAKNSIELTLELKNGACVDVQIDSKIIKSGRHEPEVHLVMLDISERKRAEKVMSNALQMAQQAKLAAENANRVKSEFISKVSHELRTPLTSIYGAMGLIWGGEKGEMPEQMHQLIGISVKNCKKLVNLVNDLLDLGNLQQGKLQFHRQQVLLEPLITEALELTAQQAQERKVTLTLISATPKLEVLTDAQRLIQVITHLLSNAIKYSPLHGSVELDVKQHEGGVRLSVTDHGCGVPFELRDHIFESFVQADCGDSRTSSGIGLGLALSKKILEQMHSQIDFSSTTGQGSCFYIDLPTPGS